MGNSSYTADAAEALRDTTAARSTMDVQDYFKAPVGRPLHTSEIAPEINPINMREGPGGRKVRECRDSAAHPNSVGVVVGFDTTASMQGQPVVFANQALPHLMGQLVHDGVLEDAAVLFCSFNDGYTRAHPFQVGQFESGLEVDDDLTRLPLQSGGGGTHEESSEMVLYFAARHTAMDCYEKRGKKGYCFILTDEKPYDIVSASMVARTFGEKLPSDIRTEDIIAEARKTFNVFVVFADAGYYGIQSKANKQRWIDLLGADYVLDLQSPEGAADLIASTIRTFEALPV